jgi:hypothetical protein
MPVYYDAQGHRINLYGQRIDPNGRTLPVPPLQQPQTPHTPQEQLEWSFGKQPQKEAVQTTTDTSVKAFKIIDDSIDINTYGNKEVMLEDALYFLNPSSGLLFKKYFDWSVGNMVIERAKFEKVEKTKTANIEIEPDPRIADIVENVKKLEEEIKKLKEEKATKRGKNGNSKNDNQLSDTMDTTENQTTV